MIDREYEFECPRCGNCCQQREWVGLTDEEVKDIVWNLPYEPSQEHIRAIEAKLREKNT
jgi:Fe-S-cluster containining protein